MWNKLQADFYMKFVTVVDTSYEILVTDFVTIWSVIYTREQFLMCIEDSNPRLEIINENIIEQIEKMLSGPENLLSHNETQIHCLNNAMKLNVMMSSSYGYPIHLRVELKKGSEQLFFQKVTQSLFRVVKDLTESQKELYDIMAKKDREIEEYKLEGGRLGLKYLKTPAFDRDEHMTKHPACTSLFGSTEIPDTILERKTELLNCANAVIVKDEMSPTNILKEERLEENVKQEILTSVDSPTLSLPESNTTDTHIKEETIKSESAIPKKKRKFLNM